MHLLKGKIKWFIFAIFIICFDLITKHIANTNLEYGIPHEITPFFNFTLLYNYGAAFSFLSSDQTSWQLIMFSAISLIASAVLIFLILKQPEKSKINLLSFSLILGGALGNFYDRAFQGYVIDFLDFHIGSYHWPAFNIADSAITIGVTLFLITSLFSKK